MRLHIAGREIDISQEEKGPELNQLYLIKGKSSAYNIHEKIFNTHVIQNLFT